VISEGVWWLASFVLGVFIAASEVILRYRNDPISAVKSPYGIFYFVLNGFFSLIGYWVLRKYASQLLPAIGDDRFLAVLVAGFGSMVLARSKLLTFKGDDGREYPLGPDLLFSTLILSLDGKIDGLRAVQRQRLVFRKMRDVDDFDLASQYVKTSLLYYQGLTDADRKEVADAIEGYRTVDWPDSLKLMALGFAIVEICGLENFDSFLDGLKVAISRIKEAKEETLSEPLPPTFDLS
jgi:hypothetical protein